MRLLTWWARSVWRWQMGLVAAGLLLATSATINAATNVVDERNEHRNDEANREQIAFLRAELECRADIAAETANIEGRIGQQTALGLVYVARDDDQALATTAALIEDLAEQLGPALERREQAVQRCAERRDLPED